MAESFSDKKCKPCVAGDKLIAEAVQKYLKALPEWQLSSDGKRITRVFDFKGFYKTMAFVNAVAWIAHSEGHHPDMEVSFSRCSVHFTTHAAGGLTENDFICASKVDKL